MKQQIKAKHAAYKNLSRPQKTVQGYMLFLLEAHSEK